MQSAFGYSISLVELWMSGRTPHERHAFRRFGSRILPKDRHSCQEIQFHFRSSCCLKCISTPMFSTSKTILMTCLYCNIVTCRKCGLCTWSLQCLPSHHLRTRHLEHRASVKYRSTVLPAASVGLYLTTHLHNDYPAFTRSPTPTPRPSLHLRTEDRSPCEPSPRLS